MESIWQGNAIFCCCREATNGSLFTAYKKRVDQEILERKAGLGTYISSQWSVAVVSSVQIKKTSLSEAFFYFLCSIFYFLHYTLNRKCITSPSLTMYSFPSTRSFPASLTLASEPYCEKSSNEITSARMNPFSKSV